MRNEYNKEELELFNSDCKTLYEALTRFLSSEYVKGRYSLGVHLAVFNSHLEFLKEQCDKMNEAENENIHH